MNTGASKRGRAQLVSLAVIFFGPLLVATLLYFKGDELQPKGRSNHGALLEPIVSLAEQLPDSALNTHNAGHWLLVYSNGSDCDEACRQALYTIRQSRLMLGRDMDRLKRIFLHGESVPDTVFLADEHKGLISLQDDAAAVLLNQKKPVELAAGGYFLLDPLGNLVLYFPPEINPADMVDDIEHLLELSRIG